MTDEGKFVMPGDNLGISEEFMPGSWTYEEDGNVFAAVSGKMAIDMKERQINVLPTVSVPPQVREGDIVIGKIWEIKQQLALVDILKIKGVERPLPGEVKGAVHISKVREAYVSDLSREFSIGDVIEGRVVNTQREPIDLTTAGKNLGVVKAYCSKCGGSHEPFNNGVRCKDCKNVESRNVSSEYGKGDV